MERKIWVCDTCNAEVDKPHGEPPKGWAQAVTCNQRKRLHLCPVCLPKVRRQLSNQYA